MINSEIDTPFLPPSTDNFVEDTYAVVRLITAVGSRLSRLSEALYVAGNGKLSDDLQNASDALMEAEKRIRDLCGNKLSKDLRASEQATGNMLLAVLGNLRTVDSASDGARGASDSEPKAAQREGKPE